MSAFALRREACDGCAASRDELSSGPREAGEQNTGHERLRESIFTFALLQNLEA